MARGKKKNDDKTRKGWDMFELIIIILNAVYFSGATIAPFVIETVGLGFITSSVQAVVLIWTILGGILWFLLILRMIISIFGNKTTYKMNDSSYDRNHVSFWVFRFIITITYIAGLLYLWFWWSDHGENDPTNANFQGQLQWKIIGRNMTFSFIIIISSFFYIILYLIMKTSYPSTKPLLSNPNTKNK